MKVNGIEPKGRREARDIYIYIYRERERERERDYTTKKGMIHLIAEKRTRSHPRPLAWELQAPAKS